MPESLMMYYMRTGLAYRNMESAERLAQHRNTGACITTVFEDSPAYYANLSRGDIIISVNGQDVPDSKALDSLLANCEYGKDIVITYLRNGIEQSTSIKPLY